MNDQNADQTSDPLNPFPDDAWIGCPHCEKPIDICAQIARARRDVGEFVLSLIFNDVPVERLVAPLERLNHDCMHLEDAVRRSAQPLSHLDVYHLSQPPAESKPPADTKNGPQEKKD